MSNLKNEERRFSRGELPALTDLLKQLGLDGDLGSIDAVVYGGDPLIASRHRLADSGAIAQLLLGTTAAVLWKTRTQRSTSLAVSARDALHALHSSHFLWQMGKPINVGFESVPINGLFQCADGRHVMLCAGPPYDKLLDGYLNILRCQHEKEAIAKSIAGRNSVELTKAMAMAGLPCAPVYDRREWLSHPQGRLLANTPVIEVEKIGDGLPVPFSKDPRSPMDSIKALDFTHVLAGPRCARSFAELGATVLHISSPLHADTHAQHLGVDLGKYCAYLDLNKDEDERTMQVLAADADVFVTSYRRSVSEKFNLLPHQLARNSRRGIVVVTINCYGHTGEWRDRPGFDPNGQAVSGFSAAEGSVEEPLNSPIGYLNDLLTGYFAVAGAIAALLRRSVEGGSYHVKLSLARSGMWVQELGTVPDESLSSLHRSDDLPFNTSRSETSYGMVEQLAQPLKFSNLELPILDRLVPLGSDPPHWPRLRES